MPNFIIGTICEELPVKPANNSHTALRVSSKVDSANNTLLDYSEAFIANKITQLSSKTVVISKGLSRVMAGTAHYNSLPDGI